ncbi:hypothetical protein BB8028_0004g09800 [Beauveria bassiana]|uniref:Uncharacterized protein n=1 Tax=Beauveria bassiana TaxID=176275 RepID=A0A2S7YDI4_BEABA|nr:hypothetical protein BB8028_0004g09800 [Beauveria bassiana]
MCQVRAVISVRGLLLLAPTEQHSFSRNTGKGYSAFGLIVDLFHACSALFPADASSALCCHQVIYQDTCKAVVSVGFVFPTLLYSNLLFETLHQAFKIASSVNRRNAAQHFLCYRQGCMAIATNSGGDNTTTLMLATCELHFDSNSSVRGSHFQCAGLLLGDAWQRNPVVLARSDTEVLPSVKSFGDQTVVWHGSKIFRGDSSEFRRSKTWDNSLKAMRP